MIKNIAYFPLQCAKNSKPVMTAVLDCLQARGVQTQENSMTADAAVIWSVLWAGRMAGNQGSVVLRTPLPRGRHQLQQDPPHAV